MRFNLQFSDDSSNFVEMRDPVTPTEVSEVIEFMRNHADEVWLGGRDETLAFNRVVTLISDNNVRVEVVFD